MRLCKLYILFSSVTEFNRVGFPAWDRRFVLCETQDNQRNNDTIIHPGIKKRRISSLYL